MSARMAPRVYAAGQGGRARPARSPESRIPRQGTLRRALCVDALRRRLIMLTLLGQCCSVWEVEATWIRPRNDKCDVGRLWPQAQCSCLSETTLLLRCGAGPSSRPPIRCGSRHSKGSNLLLCAELRIMLMRPVPMQLRALRYRFPLSGEVLSAACPWRQLLRNEVCILLRGSLSPLKGLWRGCRSTQTCTNPP